MLEALADLKGRGMRAVEAFALSYPESVPWEDRFVGHHTLFDREFLEGLGFTRVRGPGPGHAHAPRARRSVPGTGLLERAARLVRSAPVRTRLPPETGPAGRERAARRTHGAARRSRAARPRRRPRGRRRPGHPPGAPTSTSARCSSVPRRPTPGAELAVVAVELTTASRPVKLAIVPGRGGTRALLVLRAPSAQRPRLRRHRRADDPRRGRGRRRPERTGGADRAAAARARRADRRSHCPPHLGRGGHGLAARTSGTRGRHPIGLLGAGGAWAVAAGAGRRARGGAASSSPRSARRCGCTSTRCARGRWR